MNIYNDRKCSYRLCLCGRCSGVPRVKRVKRIPVRGRLVEMNPRQYMQYLEARQAQAWLAVS